MDNEFKTIEALIANMAPTLSPRRRRLGGVPGVFLGGGEFKVETPVFLAKSGILNFEPPGFPPKRINALER